MTTRLLYAREDVLEEVVPLAREVAECGGEKHADDARLLLGGAQLLAVGAPVPEHSNADVLHLKCVVLVNAEY